MTGKTVLIEWKDGEVDMLSFSFSSSATEFARRKRKDPRAVKVEIVDRLQKTADKGHN